jgi:hypothetical protein
MHGLVRSIPEWSVLPIILMCQFGEAGSEIQLQERRVQCNILYQRRAHSHLEPRFQAFPPTFDAMPNVSPMMVVDRGRVKSRRSRNTGLFSTAGWVYFGSVSHFVRQPPSFPRYHNYLPFPRALPITLTSLRLIHDRYKENMHGSPVYQVRSDRG